LYGSMGHTHVENIPTSLFFVLHWSTCWHLVNKLKPTWDIGEKEIKWRLCTSFWQSVNTLLKSGLEIVRKW
jgi:hypothetical protein